MRPRLRRVTLENLAEGRIFRFIYSLYVVTGLFVRLGAALTCVIDNFLRLRRVVGGN